MKIKNTVYSILMLCLCALPAAGMLVNGPTDVTYENRTLAQWPSPRGEDGAFNTRFFTQAGEWFEDHYAFKNEMVTANALLRAKAFKVSASDRVVLGKEGWLYYASSLDDHLGTNLMSERALFDLAHVQGMTQRELEKKGIRFLFAVAPNKNSVYPEYMPWYNNRVVSEAGNLENLMPLLEEEAVFCADLKSLLAQEADAPEREGYLYHKKDSHWTSLGAALAMDAMLTKLEKVHVSARDMTWHTQKDFTGDLDEMLFVLAAEAQDEVYFDRPEVFAYVTENESNFDPWIQTINPSREGTLMMYRDSFGNAMVPLFAQEYGNAFFSRGEPYNMSEAITLGADTVIVLRAERFLKDMAATPPALEASAVIPEGNGTITEAEPGAGEENVSHLTAEQNNELYRLTGTIAPALVDTDSRIYVQVNGEMIYEAFPCRAATQDGETDTAFAVYLSPLKMIPGVDQIRILVSHEDGLTSVWSGTSPVLNLAGATAG